MKKFIILYNGPATPRENMTAEVRNAIMRKWGEWMGKIGSAMVDTAQPMANGVAVVDDGSEGKAALLNGYSIIQAKDMKEAEALVEGHPFLSDHSGKFSVEIYELLPVPNM